MTVAVHPPRTGVPRLCFLTYRHLREFAAPVIAEYQGRADIELADGTVTQVVPLALARLAAGNVDAFVSAGANAGLLRNHVRAPVATVQLGGLDILRALISAKLTSQRVGVIVYSRTLPDLEAVKDFLNIEIAQFAYRTPDDARLHLEALRQAGVTVIVGSSIVVEMAEAAGLCGLLAYSHASIRQGFDDAIELARVARIEAERYAQLHGVLHTLEHAVLAVDRAHRVIAANPPMHRLLGLANGDALGKDLAELNPQLSLLDTLHRGVSERAHALTIGRRNWIANRTPIRAQGEIVGAAMTLYGERAVHEADNNLRIQQRRQQASARYSFSDLEGKSPAFLRALRTARRFAKTDLTVVLVGESGTGKELFAQAMHNDSSRAAKPFVAVNCAAFPENLLESELFGYEEGAFTGARRGGKRGLFEAAHTGTLFLDEIGDMPLSLQTRLLRVLQEREVLRVGSAVPVPVDFRVMAATHQPLADMVAQGRFRQDLYFRINTLPLRLPPLRERGDDVTMMAARCVDRCLARLQSTMNSGPALRMLLPRLADYAWPGNVRELENICERLAVFLIQFEDAESVDWNALAHDFPELLHTPLQVTPPAGTETRSLLPRSIRGQQSLDLHFGNRQAAADALGISRSTLWRWLQDGPPTGSPSA